MTPHNLNFTLLRPPIIHILRAAGFQSTRPAVLDTLADLAARYLLLLAHTTAMQCASNNSPVPTLQDVCAAMAEVGALKPQVTVCEEDWLGEEDLRGLEAFLEWAVGEGNREIRRISGLVAPRGKEAVGAVTASADSLPEDFLSTLKKRHSKTGEESRYQGTILGKQAEDRSVRIEGGPSESIHTWKAPQQLQLQQRMVIRTLEEPRDQEREMTEE
ncbi:MAG: hypothetical protein M1813_002916 [Trichoglossum hirsutum]|nr:MAG: hypothetical protein M1813_002916 [Trichoglossum hirsutum]